MEAAVDTLTSNIITADLELNDDLVGDNDKYIAQFTLKVWIEGWDADTYDVILTMPLYISLKFKYEEK